MKPEDRQDAIIATPVAVASGEYSSEAVSRGKLVLRRFLADRRSVIGLAIVLAFFALAYLSPLFYPWPYDKMDPEAGFAGPTALHWFGTTQTGFDVFARTMRGMQKSLIIGIVGALLATGFAAIVGAFAGYFGRTVNTVLTALIDLLLVLPAFLIIAIFSASLKSTSWIIFVFLLAAFQWMITARIVRGMTLSLKEREFVQAARFMGVPGHTIIFRHILPNMASILIIDATVNVSALVLAEVGLSFWGFGVKQPDVSLGTIIADHWQSALSFPWQFYFPAGSLIALVLAINLVGDGLRDAFDPHSTRAKSPS
jgi:peptide/nickel transport system permease protein